MLQGTGPLAFPLIFGLFALVMGLAALARVKRGEANSRGRAIAGIALGVVAIVVGLALLGFAATGLYEKAQRRGLSHNTGHLPLVAPGAISVATDFDFRRHAAAVAIEVTKSSGLSIAAVEVTGHGCRCSALSGQLTQPCLLLHH